MDVPFAIIPTGLLIGIMAVPDSDFNKKIYHAVREAVRTGLVREFRMDFKAEGMKAIEFTEKYFSYSGWGSIENVQVDIPNARAIVHVFNNPFALALLGRAKEPVDHFFRGILAGLFSASFGKTMDCVEVHCTALGEKGCEFVIKEQHEFDVSKKEVQNQLELEI